MSLLPVRPVSQGNKEGHRTGRAGRGAKGTFQGEQRPTETDPPSLYGDGFYYIPGTDTCLKLGGYLRV